MSSTYPSAIDSGTILPQDILGTTTQDGPGSTQGHAVIHNNISSAIGSLEIIVGTTAAGTLFTAFTAADKPVRHQGGTFQIAHVGTFNNSTFGTPTFQSATFNNSTIGTPAITGGTANQLVLGTPTITGGNLNNATIGTPSLTGGTVIPQMIIMQAFQGTAQTLNNATSTAITFDTENFKNGITHSVTVNPSQITVPSTGKYLVESIVAFSANGTGRRLTFYRTNGTSNDIHYREGDSVPSTANVSRIENVHVLSLTANDYFEVMGYQTTGGSLTLNVSDSWVNVYLLGT